nr:MAG TPA: hypothetical protein [Caudoviricetes sp.]
MRDTKICKIFLLKQKKIKMSVIKKKALPAIELVGMN